MKVAVYYSNTDIRIQGQPLPEIGPGEVLMKVTASGICGSDVMEWYRRPKVPLVLGHEVAGVVEKVGEGVATVAVGNRIAASHHVPCNTCKYCRSGRHTVCDALRATNFYPGGFAQYVRLPAINVDRGVYPIPDGVSDREASFAEPLACVLRGQRKIGIEIGCVVLVLGCGISGILHIALAKALGAGRVVATDISAYRLQAAERFGADAVFYASEYSPEKLKSAGGGMADRVILTTGAPQAIAQAMSSIDRAGAILVFAPTDENMTISIDYNRIFWRNDVTIASTYAGGPSDHYQALELIAGKKVPVNEMITHVLPLERIQEGFALVAKGDRSIKVIIEPQE